jgi:hypothetical protein
LQIPKHIARAVGEGVVLEHSFGREYPELEDGALGRYKLAIHCGGCMIDSQKMRARSVTLCLLELSGKCHLSIERLPAAIHVVSSLT